MAAQRFIKPTHFAAVGNSAAGAAALALPALVNANLQAATMTYADTLAEGTVVALSNSTPGPDWTYMVVKSTPSTPTASAPKQTFIAINLV